MYTFPSPPPPPPCPSLTFSTRLSSDLAPSLSTAHPQPLCKTPRSGAPAAKKDPNCDGSEVPPPHSEPGTAQPSPLPPPTRRRRPHPAAPRITLTPLLSQAAAAAMPTRCPPPPRCLARLRAARGGAGRHNKHGGGGGRGRPRRGAAAVSGGCQLRGRVAGARRAARRALGPGCALRGRRRGEAAQPPRGGGGCADAPRPCRRPGPVGAETAVLGGQSRTLRTAGAAGLGPSASVLFIPEKMRL